MSQITEEQIAEIEGRLARSCDRPWRRNKFASTAIETEDGRGIATTGGYSTNRNVEKVADENQAHADLFLALANAAPALISAARLGIAAGCADVGALRDLLIEVRDKGLIYWEPNTTRGYDSKARMLAKIDAALSQPPTATDGPPLTFTYRNHRGEVGERRVLPTAIRFGSTEWHPEPQWLLRAVDLDRSAVREFAMKDIGAPPAPAEGWRDLSTLPDVGRKFAALYEDGSGALLAWRHYDGFFDSDGAVFDVLKNVVCWTYLPDGFEFWCENCGDDSVTLRLPAAPEARS